MLGVRVDGTASASTSGRSAVYSKCIRRGKAAFSKVPGLCRGVSGGNGAQGRPSHSSGVHPLQHATSASVMDVASAVDALMQHGTDLCLLNDMDTWAAAEGPVSTAQHQLRPHATPDTSHMQAAPARNGAAAWAANGQAVHASMAHTHSHVRTSAEPEPSQLQAAVGTNVSSSMPTHQSEQPTQDASHQMLGAPRNRGAYIMGAIKKQQNLQGLAGVLQLHGASGHLNALHASAALVHAAQMLDSQAPAAATSSVQGGTAMHTASSSQSSVGHYDAQLHQCLMQHVAEHLQDLGARQAANCLWAAAKLGSHVPADLQMPAAMQQQLMEQLHAHMDDAVPQELSNALYAVACLGLTPSEPWLSSYASACQRLWPAFSRQDLALMLWAAGKLASRPPSESNSHRLSTAHTWLAHSPEASSWLAGLLASQQPWLLQNSPQELASSCWGLAQLAAASRQTGGDIHNSNRLQPPAAGVLDVIGNACTGAWGQALSESVSQQLHACGGSELSGLVSGLLQLQQLPSWRAVALMCLRAATAVADAGALQPRAAASLLHAACVQLPRAGGLLQPGSDVDTWVVVLLRALLRTAERANAYDVSLALHAVAVSRHSVPSWVSSQLLALAQQRMDSAAPASLALMLWSASRASFRVPASFLATFQRASYAARDRLSPREMAAIFWALGHMRVRPGRKWLQDTLAVICKSSPAYSTGELAQVVSSLSHMGFTPSEEWVEWVVSELQHKLCEVPPSGRAAVAALSALSGLVPTSPVAVKWVEEELIPNVLEPLVPSLGASEITCMVWACARMRREPRKDGPPQEAPAGPKVQALPLPAAHPPAAAVVGLTPGTVVAEAGGLRWLVAQQQPATSAAGPSGTVQGAQEAGAGTAGSLNGTAVHEVPKPRRGRPPKAALGTGTGAGVGMGQVSAVDGPAGANGRRRLRQGVRLSKHAGAHVLQAVDRAAGQLNSKQVSMVLYAMPRLGLRPSRSLLTSLLFDKPAAISTKSDIDLCIAMYALGSTGLKPPRPWMSVWEAEVCARAPRLNAGMLTGLMCGLSALNLSPGVPWLTAVVGAGMGALRQMAPRQLTRTYVAVADLEPRLAEQWGYDFSTLMSKHAGSSAGPGLVAGQAAPHGSMESGGHARTLGHAAGTAHNGTNGVQRDATSSMDWEGPPQRLRGMAPHRADVAG